MDADETFQLMKDTIAEIIREHGLGKIRYGLIVFGDTASIKIQFSDLSKIDNLLQLLNVIPKKRGGAALDEMFKEAERLFSAAGGRSHARKVLVAITDLASGNTPSQVSNAAKPLQDKGIKIVSVAIGSQADSKELEIFTSTENIIEEQKSVQPSELKKDIMEKVLKGKSVFNTRLTFSW